MLLTDSEPFGSNLNSPITQGTSEYSPISEGLEDDANNDSLGRVLEMMAYKILNMFQLLMSP